MFRIHFRFLPILVAILVGISAESAAAEPALSIFNETTGETITSFRPGQRVFVRFQTPAGKALKDLGTRKHFEITFAVTGPDKRTYKRSVSFYKQSKDERDDADMSKSTLEFPILIDPRTNRELASPFQIQDATSFTGAFRGVNSPGTYQAKLTSTIDKHGDGPSTEFTIEIADAAAVNELKEIIKSYEQLIPVHTDLSKQRVVFLDGATMKEIKVYKPGMHIIGRLYTEKGKTLGDLCAQTGGFKYRLKLLSPDMTRRERHITFGPDTPGFDATATQFDVDLLVDPAAFTPGSKTQRKQLLKFGETLKVLASPGMYNAVINVNRGAMFEAYLFIDLTSPETMTRMKQLAAGYRNLSTPVSRSTAKPVEKAPQPSATVALFNPATKKDITAYTPGISVKMDVATESKQAFKTLLPKGNPKDLELIVTLKAFDGDKKIANGTTSIPDLAEINSAALNIWKDPRNKKMKDWPETKVFRQYVFEQLKEAKAYKLVFESYFKASSERLDLPNVSITWDVSGENFASWQQILSGKASAADAKMRKALMSDPKLEAEMKAVLKKEGLEPLKLIIINNKWFQQRHKTSGKILYRVIYAEFVSKENDGSYLIRDVCFKQDHIDGKWGKTQRFSWGTRKEYTTEDAIK